MIEFREGVAGEASADAVAVGVVEGPVFDQVGQRLVDELPWLEAHIERAEFTGKAGQVVVVPGGATSYALVALVGLGADPGAEQVRRAAGSAAI